MKISFVVNYVNGGWKPTDTRLGGTEESVVEWAKELEKRGHEVAIYDNDSRDTYLGFGDVCINVKSSDILPKEPTIYLTNEANASDLDLSPYDCVVWPSQWAKDNIAVNNDDVYVVPHGYDPEKIYPGKKIPKQCFYASSPDRGLDVLLEAWPKVYEAHPDATLIVTYGGESNLPGVINLGECDEETMNEVYRTSDIWCHPCTGVELFCITGLKAQAADCWPVIIPAMALEETVKWGTFTSKERYADSLIDVLNYDIRRTTRKVELPIWQDSTDKLLEVIQKVVK